MKQQEDNILLEAAKKSGKFVGNVLFLPVRATMYLFNPRNLFNSWDQVTTVRTKIKASEKGNNRRLFQDHHHNIQ